MKSVCNCTGTRTPLFIGLAFLLFVMLAEFFGIILLNDGFFVYTLDDPYIHLALAENLKIGHYGVNVSEYSSPASSILWPFLITVFSSFAYFPLLVNIACAVLTIFIFWKILWLSFKLSGKRTETILFSALLILLILSTNVIGLVFMGMEHSLQLLIVTFIAFGLIVDVEKNKIEPLLLVAIVVAPLIRYENTAISLAAISYLCVGKKYKMAGLTLLLLVVFVGGFSFFLTQLGLALLPASISVKSSIVESGGGLQSFIGNIQKSLTDSRGMMLSIGLLGLLSYLLFAQQKDKKYELAFITIFAIVMHLVAGRYGWYNRYEIYIWTFLLLISLYIIGDQIVKKKLIRR